MTPIIVCSVTGRSLPVLIASSAAYNPDVPLRTYMVERTTFGQSYNQAMTLSFFHHDEIIIANDDIVLTPTSYQHLMEDVAALKIKHGDRLGIVAARSDCVREVQLATNKTILAPFPTSYVSPLFAWVSAKAFTAAQFPETNWFSDDMFCMDLNDCGFTHYVSRSYVHHAGSQTIGNNTYAMYLDAVDWIEKHRPDRLPFFKRGV